MRPPRPLMKALASRDPTPRLVDRTPSPPPPLANRSSAIPAANAKANTAPRPATLNARRKAMRISGLTRTYASPSRNSSPRDPSAPDGDHVVRTVARMASPTT